ncbi:Hormone-sensitive lipase [Lamellibrachia satsuma]|nr:Hormone-sensitive lipase [Lamellibrachia satsuma]
MAAAATEVKWEGRIATDESYRRQLSLLFKELRSQALCNSDYFQADGGLVHERLYRSFRQLYDHLDHGLESSVDQLLRTAHKYDVSPLTPANGYRSMITVVHKCCCHLMQLTRYIVVNRDSFLFRRGHYSRELDAYVTTLGQLRACLYYLQRLSAYCKEGCLFPEPETLTEQYSTAERLMLEVESLSQEPFYGRCLGFQYCESMVRILTTISLVMASYSEGYNQNSVMMKLASSVLSGGKYLLDPELRAEKIVNVTRSSDIQFCKDFWSMAEYNLMQQLPLIVCPPVQLDQVIVIPPVALELPLVDSADIVRITPPCVHSGPDGVNARLISYELRDGQDTWKTRDNWMSASSNTPVKTMEKSPGLLIHCHGGGFVAQSSASHEVYLRHWAKDLHIPILSIDYALAPEHPFPRALEEVFFAYCWALSNPHLLGWSGEKVCLVGDSAGANLVMSASMRAASYGVQCPDGIVSVYGCMLVEYIPSPARMLTLMDPLLPLGILSKCLAAYAGMTDDDLGGDIQSSPLSQSASNRDIRTTAGTPRAADSCNSSSSTTSPLEVTITPAKEAQRHQSSDSRDSGFIESSEDQQTEVDTAGHVSKHVGKHASCKDNHITATPSTLMNNTEDKTNVDSANVKKPSSTTLGASEMTNIRKRTPVVKPSSLNIGVPNHNPYTDFLRTRSPSSPNLNSSFTRGDCFKGMGSPRSLSPPGSFNFTPTYAKIRHFAQSPVTKFRQTPIGMDPYMSPILASDELLQDLCPVTMVTCHLDPMLDDSVTFIKRLHSLGKEAHLEVVDDLPHGFLNFVLISHEAKQASDLCTRCIRNYLTPDTGDMLFDIDDVDIDSDDSLNGNTGEEEWEVLQ